jgi:hypothetical protein
MQDTPSKVFALEEVVKFRGYRGLNKRARRGVTL